MRRWGARRGIRRETNRGLVAVTASVPAMTASDEIVSVAIADVRRAWILRWPRHMGGSPVIGGHTVRVGPSTEIQSKAGAAVSRTSFAAAVCELRPTMSSPEHHAGSKLFSGCQPGRTQCPAERLQNRCGADASVGPPRSQRLRTQPRALRCASPISPKISLGATWSSGVTARGQ
jgi:hypothetical protein